MTARTIGEASDALQDAADVLLVVRTVLSAEAVPLTPAIRNALATTVWLASARVASASETVEQIRTAPR